jgi:hypothetical protein
MIEADITAIAQLVDAGMPKNDALEVVHELASAHNKLLFELLAERDHVARLLDDALRELETRGRRATRLETARRIRARLAEMQATSPANTGAALLAEERADELADQQHEEQA